MYHKLYKKLLQRGFAWRPSSNSNLAKRVTSLVARTFFRLKMRNVVFVSFGYYIHLVVLKGREREISLALMDSLILNLNTP